LQKLRLLVPTDLDLMRLMARSWWNWL